MGFPNCNCGLTGGCELCSPTIQTHGGGTLAVSVGELARLRQIEELAELLCLEHGTFHAVLDKLKKLLKPG